MRVTHWMILGCALGLAFTGSVLAASVDTQGVGNSTHATANQTSHGSDSSGGDAVGIARDTGTINSGETAAGASRNGNDHSGAAASSPAPAPRPHLGWQSLLPGSIQ